MRHHDMHVKFLHEPFKLHFDAVLSGGFRIKGHLKAEKRHSIRRSFSCIKKCNSIMHLYHGKAPSSKLPFYDTVDVPKTIRNYIATS